VEVSVLKGYIGSSAGTEIPVERITAVTSMAITRIFFILLPPFDYSESLSKSNQESPEAMQIIAIAIKLITQSARKPR
jgi:hypothetical protein